MKRDYLPLCYDGQTTFLTMRVEPSPEIEAGGLSIRDQVLCSIRCFHIQIPVNLAEPVAASCVIGMFYLNANPDSVVGLHCTVWAPDGRELLPSDEFDCIDVAESYPELLTQTD